ncbi:MAG: hypothetical protein RSB08_02210 [Clostridia bacterium]
MFNYNQVTVVSAQPHAQCARSAHTLSLAVARIYAVFNGAKAVGFAVHLANCLRDTDIANCVEFS